MDLATSQRSSALVKAILQGIMKEKKRRDRKKRRGRQYERVERTGLPISARTADIYDRRKWKGIVAKCGKGWGAQHNRIEGLNKTKGVTAYTQNTQVRDEILSS